MCAGETAAAGVAPVPPDDCVCVGDGQDLPLGQELHRELVRVRTGLQGNNPRTTRRYNPNDLIDQPVGAPDVCHDLQGRSNGPVGLVLRCKSSGGSIAPVACMWVLFQQGTCSGKRPSSLFLPLRTVVNSRETSLVVPAGALC